MMTILCLAMIISGCSGSTTADTAIEPEPESSSEETWFNDLNDFTAVTSGGEEITQSFFENYDVTIINIWATFCPPCLEEMPQIAELESSRPDNIGLVLLCADAHDEPEYMQEILDEEGFKGTCIVSEDGDLGKLVGKLQFVPTTIFVDSEGNLVAEPVVGGSADPKAIYYEQINKYFEEQGLETIS